MQVLALVFLAQSALALTMTPSPTLLLLQDEAAKDPAAKPKSEQAKAEASEAYTGEGMKGVHIQTLEPVEYLDPSGKKQEGEAKREARLERQAAEVVEEKPQSSKKPGKGPSYHFEGSTPLKGVTIYTPREDKTGDERTEKPEPKNLVSPWITYGALAIGLAATIAGIFFPPLLFLGGLGLGVGGLLWYLNKKYSS